MSAIKTASILSVTANDRFGGKTKLGQKVKCCSKRRHHRRRYPCLPEGLKVEKRNIEKNLSAHFKLSGFSIKLRTTAATIALDSGVLSNDSRQWNQPTSSPWCWWSFARVSTNESVMLRSLLFLRIFHLPCSVGWPSRLSYASYFLAAPEITIRVCLRRELSSSSSSLSSMRSTVSLMRPHLFARSLFGCENRNVSFFSPPLFLRSLRAIESFSQRKKSRPGQNWTRVKTQSNGYCCWLTLARSVDHDSWTDRFGIACTTLAFHGQL